MLVPSLQNLTRSHSDFGQFCEVIELVGQIRAAVGHLYVPHRFACAHRVFWTQT